jgi:hypothetical protein
MKAFSAEWTPNDTTRNFRLTAAPGRISTRSVVFEYFPDQWTYEPNMDAIWEKVAVISFICRMPSQGVVRHRFARTFTHYGQHRLDAESGSFQLE